MPLSLHVGTDRADSRAGEFVLNVKNVPPSVFVNKDYPVRRTLADLMFSGVFERHPGLRIGTVEHELGWIPFFLQQLDYTYTDKPPRGPEWARLSDPDALPSQFFRTNCFASFQEDTLGHPAARHDRRRDPHVGERLSPYGVDVSTLARGPRRGARGRPGRRGPTRIVAGNAAELYSFTLPDADAVS